MTAADYVRSFPQLAEEISRAVNVPGAMPDHVYMDVARFHAMRGEPIPIALAGHGTGVHIVSSMDDSPPTWHYVSDCSQECP